MRLTKLITPYLTSQTTKWLLQTDQKEQILQMEAKIVEEVPLLARKGAYK